MQNNWAQRNGLCVKVRSWTSETKTKPNYREFSFLQAIFSKIIFHFEEEGRQHRILVVICSFSYICPQKDGEKTGHKMEEWGNCEGTLLVKLMQKDETQYKDGDEDK